MKEICELCEMAIEAGNAERDPVLAAHLAQCPDCRAFAEFQAEVLNTAPVMPEATPTLADILAERERRKVMRRNSIRLVAWPLSLAAAAMLAVAGLRFVLFAEPVPTAPAEQNAPAVTQLADAAWQVDAGSDWSMDSLNLAWDGGETNESALALLRQENKTWNIEVYNPIEEEQEI